jgi:hypothetical protein
MKSSLRNKLSVLVQRRLQVERRGARRVIPTHRTLCLFQGPGDSERGTAIVQNLSREGVAVLAERDFPSGTLLHLLLVNEAHVFSLAADVKVIRSQRVGHEHYLLAGPFVRPLRHEEVIPLIT